MWLITNILESKVLNNMEFTLNWGRGWVKSIERDRDLLLLSLSGPWFCHTKRRPQSWVFTISEIDMTKEKLKYYEKKSQTVELIADWKVITCLHCASLRLLKVQMSSSPSAEPRESGGAVTILLVPQGYIASRVLSRRACYILKMNHKAIPALDQLKRYIYERKVILEYA